MRTIETMTYILYKISTPGWINCIQGEKTSQFVFCFLSYCALHISINNQKNQPICDAGTVNDWNTLIISSSYKT